MKQIIAMLSGLGVAGAALAGISVGQTIEIDFGTDSSALNAYTDVVISNGVTESFIGTLKDTTGADVAGVGFSVENKTGDDSGEAASTDRLLSNDSASTGRLTDGTVDPLTRGHFVLTFSGLDPALAYDLTGGYDNDNDNFNAIWQADGQSYTTDSDGGTGYGTLTGLKTDGSSNLVIYVIRENDASHATIGDLALAAFTPPLPPIEPGDVIRVDFGTTVPGGNYNVIHSGNLSISNLILFSDGSAVDVGLEVTSTNPYDNINNVASTAGLLHIDATNAEVYADGFLSADASAADSVTLSFTGLDDSLYYYLSGGLSRSSSPENFSTTWSVPGVSSQIADGTEGNGYVEFFSLMSSGGTLTVTLTDNVRQSGLAQLALVATDVPPETELPPAPELPEDVTVFFNPTASEAVATIDKLDAVTIGGRWEASLSDTRRFDENIGGFLYLMDGASAQGDFVELVLDGGGLGFSATDVAIGFEMLAARASATAGDKHTTLTGYDGTNEIFRLKVDSNSDNTLNTVTVTTDDGDESMGFVPLRWITENSGPPSGLQDFRIVLSGTNISFSGSSLTEQEGPVLNSSQTLTSLRWEITGAATDNQGFWLDDIRIWDGLPTAPRDPTDKPNIIFVLMDDMGFSDISCYGATKLDTPNLDAMAADGLRFTTFLSAANVCSPSRAAFLTGAYAQRCGIPMAVNEPFQNHWFLGLDPDEITIAEQCRSQGYKTFMIGKWHLGTEDVFLPFNQGFDRWLGTWGNGGEVYDDNEVIYSTFPETILTSLYTQRVREHIRENRDRPFFIYYPHNYPHTPFSEGNAFDGSTGSGERSDVLKEVDWGMGQMVAELEAQGILENTMIVFSSDNGAVPPSNYANAPFRGSKYVTWEGGHRVPFIVYWKGQVQTPAVLDAPQVWAMDLFPTVSELVGAEVPDDRVYDGTSLVPLLTDDEIDRDADEPFYYYTGDNLQCVRSGDWKLHVPRTEYQLPWWDQIKPPPSTYSLYDLSTDVHEDTDVSAANPDIVAALSNLAESIVLELGNPDPATGIMVWGSGQRGTGTLFPEVPTIVNNESDYSYVPDWNTLTAAEKGRGATRQGMGGVVDAANEFINGSVLPYGWDYLEASAPIGGSEAAMTFNTVVGSEGNTGFAGSGAAALIGSADAGSYVIDSANTANNGVVGTDLLVVPGDGYVIVRYTIEENDVSFGKTSATISGSFRDLVGGTSDDSVSVQVFHNDTELFLATGSAGRLLLADGSFNLTNVTATAGDTISFVVGSNGSIDGDEIALRASLGFEVSADPAAHAATIGSGTFFPDGTAMLQFSGTPGQGYCIEQTSDLTASNGWNVVDELPYLPTSPYGVHVDVSEEQGFWRIELRE
ncbi:Arylsulfatase [Pontiella desulfatans]|uniref:Arylsulfatase n=1 Tax=Pontiella desulfatans TaxID=2750659 RepID=A0A6C2TZT4_PONDE|nr:sulfatase-like hydrolase/transferase [Pontiella desulfatans]SPS73767.1 sulfatase S1_14 [Kiritimatiellales bacterium]VGO13210.1 Arylsulfatase [Pontiella desulfatans]